MYFEKFDIGKIFLNFNNSIYNHQNVLLLLVAEKTTYDIDTFIDEANKKNIRIIGGIFPAIFQNNQKFDTGVIVKQLSSHFPVFTVKNIDSKKFTLPNINIPLDSETKPTILNLVDGLCPHIDNFLHSLHTITGNTVNYLGGGAGSLSLKQSPCVFSNEGIFANAAIIAVIEWEADLSVKHGWERVYGPLLATKTKLNIIQELNWEKPFDIYQKIIASETGITITQENFFSVAKFFPFGINKENAEYIVRDPIGTNENGELICVGEIPENTVLDLLKGNHSLLVDAAIKATSDAIRPGNKYIETLVIDCISRNLFMEENFDDELNGILEVFKTKGIFLTVEGALTLGEIASDGNGALEFFNKTILVSMFYEKQ